MPVEVIMPKVDMDMETGKISLWHVAEGARVAKGALIFEIETAKSAMEVESPGAGTIHFLTAAGNVDVAIGEAVAWIYADGETVGARPETAKAIEIAVKPETATAAVAVEHAPATASARATPYARRLAREHSLDLATLTGTSNRGRISRADVEAALAGTDRAKNQLAILSSGSGHATPYLFIHGFANDASGWLPLLKALPKDRPIHRLELPGHGRSPALPVQSFAELADEVLRAFDQLKLGKVHLIGHSLGGALAIALAARRSTSIASLTLFAPAGLGAEISADTLSGITHATDAASLGPWLKRLMASPEFIDDAYVRAVAEQRQSPELRQAQIAMAKILFKDGRQAFDLTAELSAIQCPVRVIWGRQDTIIPMAHALNLPGQIAINLIDRAGHLPHIEQAEISGKIVREVAAAADATRPL